jgi:hypothetical protein
VNTLSRVSIGEIQLDNASDIEIPSLPALATLTTQIGSFLFESCRTRFANVHELLCFIYIGKVFWQNVAILLPLHTLASLGNVTQIELKMQKCKIMASNP